MHPFAHHKIIFATLHKKERILAPLFAELGCELLSASLDTDQFGTFSGEKERNGSVSEILRKKIDLARTVFPDERFFMASEGSFVPHPFLGVLPSNLESLLFFDAKYNAEIYAEHFTTRVWHREIEISDLFDIEKLVNDFDLHHHAVIVRPKESFTPIFKGLHDREALLSAIHTCLEASLTRRVLICSDLRAQHNAYRRDAILEAGKKLITSLKTQCPHCNYPGYSISEGLPGLPCEDCGTPTAVTKDVVFKCSKCQARDVKPRPDGLQWAEARNCDLCNP